MGWRGWGRTGVLFCGSIMRSTSSAVAVAPRLSAAAASQRKSALSSRRKQWKRKREAVAAVAYPR